METYFNQLTERFKLKNFPKEMKEGRRKWKQDLWSMEISVLHIILLIFTITQ